MRPNGTLVDELLQLAHDDRVDSLEAAGDLAADLAELVDETAQTTRRVATLAHGHRRAVERIPHARPADRAAVHAAADTTAALAHRVDAVRSAVAELIAELHRQRARNTPAPVPFPDPAAAPARR